MTTKKNKGGRPTKYTPELLEKAREYLERGPWLSGGYPPSAVELSIALKVAKSTIYLWAANDPDGEFSDVLTRVEDMREFELSKGGLTGVLNPVITKMMLTKFGYSDKQEIDHTTKGDKMPAPFGFVDVEDKPDED